MFAAKLKTNARKSTHSGKVHLGMSSLQDQHWQDVPDYSLQGKQERRSSMKTHSSSGQVVRNSKGGSSTSNSSDRSIWDTNFTEPEPEPVPCDSSDDMIWISPKSAVTLKPLPKFKVKGCLASPKFKTEPDRNIFSALGKPSIPGKRASDSTTSTSLQGVHRSHQSCNNSRNISNLCGRSNKDFVFKKPTAPPPVSRMQSSGSTSNDRRQQQPPSSASTSKSSGQVQSRQRNCKRVHHASVTKAHAGVRTKSSEHCISIPKLSRPVGTSNRFYEDEIYTANDVFGELGEYIDSSLYVDRVHRSAGRSSSQRLEELKAYTDSPLNFDRVKGVEKASSLKANRSSSKNKPCKVSSKPDSRWSITTTHNIPSQKPSQHLGHNVSPRPAKNVHAKSTGKQSAVKKPSQTLSNKPAPSHSSDRKYAEPALQSSQIIDLCKPANSRKSVTARLRVIVKASPREQEGVHVNLKANRNIDSPKGDLSHPRTLKAPQPHTAQSTSLTPRTPTPKRKSLTQKNPSKSLPQKNPIKSLPRKNPIKSLPQKNPIQKNPIQKNPIQKNPIKKIPVKSLPQKNPIQKNPIQKNPIQKNPIQKNPIQKNPIQKNPIQKNPIQRNPIKKNPIKKNPIKKNPIKKNPIKKNPIKKNPIKKNPIKKNPIKKNPIKKNPIKKNPIKKNPIKTPPQKNPIKSLTGKNPINCDAVNRVTSSPKEVGNSDSVINNEHISSIKDKAIIHLNRLEVRLSPVKIQEEDLSEFDDIDGILFASFGTQSELESYLKTQPEEMLTPGQKDSCLKTSPLEVEHFSDSKPSTSLEEEKDCHQKQLDQFQQQLVADLRCHNSCEILHPRLTKHRFSIRRELVEKGTRSINLRTHGIRFKAKKPKNTYWSQKKASKRHPKTTGLKSDFIKERSATPTTGLKIKFTIAGKKSLATKDLADSKSTPEVTSSKTSQMPMEEVEPEMPKAVKKLPVEESIPFKPFEKEVMSSKSAFVSDALDRYLQDEEKQSAFVTGHGHPLLQSKASTVTFKMPSKQSSYIKTLDMALRERQMAKYKSKVPTVAETAQKLAKCLKHASDTFKTSGPQSAPKGKEVAKDSKTTSHFESSKAAVPRLAPKDIQVKQTPVDLQSSKTNISTKPNCKEVRLNEKKRYLEEKLENVKKKLKESTAFLKKSPSKGKPQTSWATKLKIVNSRLVQQLNSPGRNAHLVRAKQDGLKSVQQTQDELKAGGDDSEDKSSKVSETDKLFVKRKDKNKTPLEFVRLDQQTKCSKAFCRLGCVCESINLNIPVEKLTKHCRKATCMFECICQRNNVRILRNRKRPNIFQEKSMLFYDGVGMFSNNNYLELEEPSSSTERREKPGILGPNRGLCARAIVYKPKPKCQAKDSKLDKIQGQGGQAVGASPSPSQSLSKQDVGNTRPTLNLSMLNGKQNYFQLQKRKMGSDKMASDIVPSVLYTPVHVPLSGQHASVLLYAPVNTLPYMVQKVQLQTQPGQAVNGNKSSLLTADYSQPGVLQVANISDAKTSDNKIKPVAVISPSTALSASQTDANKTPNTDASFTAQYIDSKTSVDTDRSCAVCQVLQSGEVNVFKSSSLETINKGHTCTKGADKFLKKSIPLLEVPTNSAQTAHAKQSTDTSSKNQPDDNESSQCVDPAKSNITHSPRRSEKETKDLEVPLSEITSKVEIPADSRGSKNTHDTSISEDQVLKGPSQNDHPTPATISASTSAAQTSEVNENAQEATHVAERTIRAIVTRTKSPVTSPTTSPAARSSSKGRPLKPSLLASTTDLNKKLEFASQIQPQETRADTKTSNTSLPERSTIKIPTFMEPKVKDTNKSKMTKTKVFLPGTPLSAIGTKRPVQRTRSPLLIEIQSECNWAETKNDILSTIAKHTSTHKGTPGVVRVGKFLVEILSKEEQMNIAASQNKSKINDKVLQTTPLTSTMKVEVLTPGSLPRKSPLCISSQQAGFSQAILKGTQPPCIEKSSPKESQMYMPHNIGNRLMNFTSAGTVTAATPGGKAPLLTSLPLGSIMLSDGKNPAGYLVPLKAVQDQLAAGRNNSGAKPLPIISGLKSASGMIQNMAQMAQISTAVLGPIGSYCIPSKNPLSSSDSSTKTDAAKTSKTQGATSQTDSRSSSSSAGMSSASPVNCGGLNYTHLPIPGTTEEPRQKANCDPDLKLTSSDALSTQVAAVVPVLESINRQSHPLEGTDSLCQAFAGGKLQIVTADEASENSSSSGIKPDMPADAPGLPEAPEDFIDVESLDGVQPMNPPFSKYRPRLLKPTPVITPLIFQAALDAAKVAPMYVPIAPKTSRRKVEHKVRPSVLVEDLDEEIDVTSCDDTINADMRILVKKTPSTRIAVGDSQSQSSSGKKRKRKSPVVQKKSAMAFEEPEFIESYYEVSSEEEDGEEESKKFKRDKPNKVLHLIKERQRRRDQSDLFGGLKFVMLNNKDSKIAKVAILTMAQKEIKFLESIAFKIEVEMTKLKQDNFQKRSKLASLLGISIMNFPTPFADQKDPDFDEYFRELHDGSDGIASSAQSETTSQDSESIDMESSDDDDDDDDEEATREQPNPEHKDDDIDVCGVESQPQTTNNDPTPATIYGRPARHLGLPKTVPLASATRIVLKPRSTKPAVADTSKGPVPVALTALPFDFNMTLPLITPQAEKVVSALPDEDTGEANQDLVIHYPSNDVPGNTTSVSKTNSNDSEFSEKDVEVTSTVSINASPVATETDCENSGDRSGGVEDSSDQDSEIKESCEVVSRSTLNDKTVAETSEVKQTSQNDPSLSLPEIVKDCDVVESSKEEGGVSVEQKPGVSPEKVNQSKDNLSNILSETSTDNGKLESRKKGNISKEQSSLVSCSDSDNDDVELISNKDLDSEIILVDDDNTKPPLSNKEKMGQKGEQGSPKKGNDSKSGDKEGSSTDSSDPSLNLNVLSIETKGGVVIVTCDNGEVIPLAVVKASSDGTMQVAVEGDISSEKVEELLSKTEVMESLEKVADEACDKFS